VLELVTSVPCWEFVFCVKWDMKPYLSQSASWCMSWCVSQSLWSTNERQQAACSCIKKVACSVAIATWHAWCCGCLSATETCTSQSCLTFYTHAQASHATILSLSSLFYLSWTLFSCFAIGFRELVGSGIGYSLMDRCVSANNSDF